MPGDNTQQGGGGTGVFGTLLRMVLFWYIGRQLIGGFTSSKAPQKREEFFMPKLSKASTLDMRVYLTEDSLLPALEDDTSLVWSEQGLSLGQNFTRQKTIQYQPSPAVQHNGSLYLHVVFATEEEEDSQQPGTVFSKTHPLIWYQPKRKQKEGVNLLKKGAKNASEPELPKDSEGGRPVVAYLKPNVSFHIVDDFSTYGKAGINPLMAAHMDLNADAMDYNPTVFFNDFWLLQDSLIEMNDTVTEVPLHLSVSPMAMWKWSIYLQMEQSFSMQKSMGTLGETDMDEFKRVLTEGNPIFLAITMVVSLLHSVFDMLAFKNDIGFWKNKQNVEGLSIKTILINVFCQVVIFLYLVDNETSMVVLFSAGVGCLIEFWKVTKAMDVTVEWSGSFPRVHFRNKSSYEKTKTQQYDDEAMRYLAYVLYPLMIGYAIYALLYNEHKSWYSFVLNTLVGGVYMFGFILMCPQLYLNYKLKSVAHLPWRQMTYKFLNTIIDDLFAFVIKMPLLHRLSVFRDDLVFLVYLYQRWVYRVDRKRANEFGYAAEADDDADATPAVAGGSSTPALEQSKPAASAAPGDAAVQENGTSERKKDK